MITKDGVESLQKLVKLDRSIKGTSTPMSRKKNKLERKRRTEARRRSR